MFEGFACAVWERSKQQAKKRLHYLDYEMKVAL